MTNRIKHNVPLIIVQWTVFALVSYQCSAFPTHCPLLISEILQKSMKNEPYSSTKSNLLHKAQSTETQESNQPLYSPLSMKIDELSPIVGGRGRALASWDCYRQGIDPVLLYSSIPGTEETNGNDLNNPSSSTPIVEGMSSFLILGKGTTAHQVMEQRLLPNKRSTQGLGKKSLKKLQNAVMGGTRCTNNSCFGTIGECIASLSHVSTSLDGTTKLLLRMASDGLEVETVIIPWENRGRSTLCIS